MQNRKNRAKVTQNHFLNFNFKPFYHNFVTEFTQENKTFRKKTPQKL